MPAAASSTVKRRSALREFADAFGIPVVTTLMGIGAFDTTHPLSMRMLGMHGTAFANYAVEDCDFLIAVGSRFDDRVAGDPPKFARERASALRTSTSTASEINKVKSVQLEPRRPARRGAACAAPRTVSARSSSATTRAGTRNSASSSALRDELRSRPAH